MGMTASLFGFATEVNAFARSTGHGKQKKIVVSRRLERTVTHRLKAVWK